MTTHRFMVSPSDIDAEQGIVRLSNKGQLRQIVKVLRLGRGASIDFIDGCGGMFRCKITKLHRDELEAKIIESTTLDVSQAHLVEESRPDSDRLNTFGNTNSKGYTTQNAFEFVEPRQSDQSKNVPPNPKLSVILPILKGPRFKIALEKLTEIGVDKIVPVVATRSVVQSTDEEKEDGGDSGRMKRWMSILRESTEQCERLVSPYMVNVRTLRDVFSELKTVPSDPGRRVFICTERREAPHLIHYLYNKQSGEPSPAVPMSDIYIIIGPEGGLTAEEVDTALSIGCTACSLGPTILRAETAAIVAASLVASFGEILWCRDGIST